MGASATDSDPPSGAALAAALGRADEAGLLAAHDSYGPDLLGYAEFLLAGRPPAATEPADEAAAAVLDALLVASGAVADLADPDRMPTWLFALTRNECLRRGAVTAPEAEAAELGRRGLGPLQVAALLGFAPAALPGRVPPTATPPAWLEAALVAAAGPEGAGRRAELTRRARPFEPDGFPVPLDRRRLSSKVLAWSAGAVVVIALGLLVGLPARGNAGGSGVAPAALAGTPAPTAVAAPPAPADDPIPTLGQAPFGPAGGTSAPAPSTAVSAEADTGRPAAPAPTTRAPAAAPQRRTDGADRGSRTSGALALSWTPASVSCAGWTARLHATTGGVAVSRVTAVAPRAGGTVALQPDGDGWSGDLTGLPANRTVSVTVFADGPVRPASARLRVSC